MKKILILTLTFAIAVSGTFYSMESSLAKESLNSKRMGTINTKFSTKRGFVKEKGRWYLYRYGYAVKGLNKYKGKYYFFNGKGQNVAGLITVNKAQYKFVKDKTGKAPAVADKAVKIRGKLYYFRKNGKKYDFTFKDTGSSYGNTAVGRVVSKSKLKKSASAEKNLKVFYESLCSNYNYAITGVPNLSNSKWLGRFAYDFTRDGGGKCYGWAAITGLGAKALGFDSKIICGKVEKISKDVKKGPFEHCFVVVNKDDKEYIIDSQYEKRENPGLQELKYFMKEASKTEKDSEGNIKGYTLDLEKETALNYLIEKTF